MCSLNIYSVSNRYINFLRSDERLQNVFDNKEDVGTHTRKYLGAVFIHNNFYYYIPFSSPKKSDYIIKPNGDREIRKSIVPIIRMTTKDTLSGELELKGTLKISNMIPVPAEELIPYSISDEKDMNYKQLVTKEYSFITSNIAMILKNAKILYNQKINADTLFLKQPAPKYLNSTVDFKYAEEKCLEFTKTNSKGQKSLDKILEDIKEYQDAIKKEKQKGFNHKKEFVRNER